MPAWRRRRRPAAKASELATKLLTFSKGGVPVSELICSTASSGTSVSYAVRGSGDRVLLRDRGDLWAAHADAGQIGQAIDNLVRNAAEAMSWGGVVRVRAGNVIIEGGGPEFVKPGGT